MYGTIYLPTAKQQGISWKNKIVASDALVYKLVRKWVDWTPKIKALSNAQIQTR